MTLNNPKSNLKNKKINLKPKTAKGQIYFLMQFEGKRTSNGTPFIEWDILTLILIILFVRISVNQDFL
jgi:hypothetical protein